MHSALNGTGNSVSRHLSTRFQACLHISVQERLGNLDLAPNERAINSE